MSTIIKGSCFTVGDDITVYQIISQVRWTACGLQIEELGKWAFEPLVPEFQNQPNGFRNSGWEIVIAGKNFGGGGKSNDHPILTLKGAGVKLVIAQSLDRIFFRNCTNLGLPAVECPQLTGFAQCGDQIRCNLMSGELVNLRTGAATNLIPLSKLALEILEADSLLNYCRQNLNTPERLFCQE